MTIRPILGLLAFLACWFAFAGGGGCTPEESPTVASASVRTYSTPPWINADGVIWAPAYHATDPGVEIMGAGERYLYAGGIDGPLPLNAVYECSSTGCAAGTSHHCPGGSSTVCGTCPTPCFEYHENEALAHETTGRFSYRDHCARDYGDGVSAEKIGAAWSGEIEVLRGRFADLHDDGAEHDGCKSMSVKDSLFDRVFMGFAMKPRVTDPQDCTGSMIELDRVLVRLHRFANAFEQKPGHGGVFKLEDGNLPWFKVKDSTFLVGQLVGEHQHVLPPPDRFAQPSDCAGNVLLFSGDEAARLIWLADTDGADSRTNQQKLDALAYCYTFTYRQPGESFGDFFFNNWLPLWNAWINSHQAGTGC